MSDSFEAYFRDYAAAFDRFDSEAIASYYACPCLMVNNAVVFSLTTPEAIAENMNSLLASHRAQNVGRARVSDPRTDAQSSNLVIVTVRWRVYNHEDVLLWHWWNTYNLVEHGRGWKIAVSTTHPMLDGEEGR